jgi:hypothetical protein
VVVIRKNLERRRQKWVERKSTNRIHGFFGGVCCCNDVCKQNVGGRLMYLHKYIYSKMKMKHSFQTSSSPPTYQRNMFPQSIFMYRFQPRNYFHYSFLIKSILCYHKFNQFRRIWCSKCNINLITRDYKWFFK